jgi:hypothetical protein
MDICSVNGSVNVGSSNRYTQRPPVRTFRNIDILSTFEAIYVDILQSVEVSKLRLHLRQIVDLIASSAEAANALNQAVSAVSAVSVHVCSHSGSEEGGGGVGVAAAGAVVDIAAQGIHHCCM